jgi:hypothetical protein
VRSVPNTRRSLGLASAARARVGGAAREGPRLWPQRAVLFCLAPHGVGVKESDTGLSKPNTWDLIADKQMLEKEAPLLVRGRPAPPLCCVHCCSSAPTAPCCPVTSHLCARWVDVGVGWRYPQGSYSQ